jgi:hypothetical protein
MHTRGAGLRRGRLMYPLKLKRKLDHKNAIKMKIDDPLPDFIKTPSTPSKETENDCAVCIYSMSIIFWRSLLGQK